jgi:hypothetical protein
MMPLHSNEIIRQLHDVKATPQREVVVIKPSSFRGDARHAKPFHHAIFGCHDQGIVVLRRMVRAAEEADGRRPATDYLPVFTTAIQ